MKTAIEYLKSKVLKAETLKEKEKYRNYAYILNNRDYEAFTNWYCIHLSQLEY